MLLFFLIKATIIYQSHSNHDIVFNCIFRYSLDYIKYFMSSILNMVQYFRSILNKGVYGILLILTQNAYLYTPVFSYALYIPVFIRIPALYKNLYFPYSAMFYAVKQLSYHLHPYLIIFNGIYFYLKLYSSHKACNGISFYLKLYSSDITNQLMSESL